MKLGLIPGNHTNSRDCVSYPKNYEKLKSCIKQLINQGTVQIRRLTKDDKETAMLDITYPAAEVQIPINPLIIQVHLTFPYESTQVVPWRYEPKVYRKRQESMFLTIIEPNIIIIIGPRGMTRSGRVFSLAP